MKESGQAFTTMLAVEHRFVVLSTRIDDNFQIQKKRSLPLPIPILPGNLLFMVLPWCDRLSIIRHVYCRKSFKNVYFHGFTTV